MAWRKRLLSLEEVEELFASLDETGHRNPALAARERARREKGEAAVAIDPLSGKDPSGSQVGTLMNRVAMVLIIVLLAVVVAIQVSCGVARRASTANLAQVVDVQTVTSALYGGVEWGGGFTQFPERFTVLEADEATGRVDVTVTDTTSGSDLDALSSSQIQATAFSINALLNPNIDTVIYRVQAHFDEDGEIEGASWFGFAQPTGPIKPFMTFIWTKSVSASGGFNFNCTITGLDAQMTDRIRESIAGATTLFSGTQEAAEESLEVNPPPGTEETVVD